MIRRPLSLGKRVTLFFAAVAVIGGAGLAVATYLFARDSLIDQRVVTAQSAAAAHATDLAFILANDPTPADLDRAVRDVATDPGGFALLIDAGSADPSPRPLSSRQGFSIVDFPDELVEQVQQGSSVRQIYERDGDPWLGVGIWLTSAEAGYFEAFPLDSTQTALTTLATALLVGAALATVAATFFGWSTSRRLLRPISRVADAAGDIASGQLDARLDRETDPDLNRLAGSFNEMADAVQLRIQREQRFASDVSHELRSPITALTAAVEVLDARRDDLPERTRQALDVVVSQVRRFDDMVIDLLELSRLDAGTTDFHREPVDIVELCDRVSQKFGYGDLPIEVHRRAKRQALVDRFRFERILGNLLDNAANHAGGPVRIAIEPAPGKAVLVAVEDAGPGVPEDEREQIFQRFTRGGAARHRVGTGLGLALVAEHVVALGGSTWVEDRPGGGARFVVQLPTRPS